MFGQGIEADDTYLVRLGERLERNVPERGWEIVNTAVPGYNTVMEVLSLRKPSVVVPFAQGGETEQTVRAERLAAAGCLEMVAESELAPERLARAIERAASVTESERASRPVPDLDGARKTATILRQILEGRGDGELG